MPATADLPFSWRRIALPAYGPSLVGSIGHGAIVPVVALTARELGASVSVAALFVSIVAVAEFVGSVPVGIFVDRVGERTALVIGGLLEVMAGLIGWFAPNLWVLALAAVVMGPAGGIFIVARQSYLGHIVPAHQRARAMSTLGGVARIGWFIGPLAAAPLIAVHGARAAFLVLIAGGWARPPSPGGRWISSSRAPRVTTPARALSHRPCARPCVGTPECSSPSVSASWSSASPGRPAMSSSRSGRTTSG